MQPCWLSEPPSNVLLSEDNLSFPLPSDLVYNRARIDEASGYARDLGVQSWPFIVAEEFVDMAGGMFCQQGQDAMPHCARVISDAPRVLNLDLAQPHVAALDALPRRTLVF